MKYGKHVNIDPNHPQALGICDYTGFVFKRKDLVKQMEWRGNALVWTGYFVGRPYVDKPQPQLRPPILFPDPVPIRDPRPQQPTSITWSQGPAIAWSQIDTANTWTNYGGLDDGVPALPAEERLQALQNPDTTINQSWINYSGLINSPDLSPQERLQALQNFNWSSQ